MPRRHHPPERVVAAALIALWLAVPLAFVFHGSHGHHYCLEHQSFEERDELAGRASRCATGVGVRLTADVSPAADDVHEGCPVSLTRRSGALATALAVSHVPPTSEGVALDEQSWRGVLQIAPLTSAPKHGPPGFVGHASSLS